MDHLDLYKLDDNALKTTEFLADALNKEVFSKITKKQKKAIMYRFIHGIKDDAPRFTYTNMYIKDSYRLKENDEKVYWMNLEVKNLDILRIAFEKLKVNAMHVYYDIQQITHTKYGFQIKDQFGTVLLVYCAIESV